MDNAPCFEEECLKMRIKVLHSLAYNSQSQGLVERMVGIWKGQLKKAPKSMSQLQMDFAVFFY